MTIIYEGDFSTLPVMLPVEEGVAITPDHENSMEDQVREQIEHEVACGWRSPEQAEELLTGWRNKRIQQFGASIISAA